MVAPPPSAIRSSVAASSSLSKDEGFSGSNPLARRPIADKPRASNVGTAEVGGDRIEDIRL